MIFNFEDKRNLKFLSNQTLIILNFISFGIMKENYDKIIFDKNIYDILLCIFQKINILQKFF